MSRYVQVEVDLANLSEVAGALDLSNVRYEGTQGLERPLLAGTFECADEPVDLRLRAGTFGSVADFGFKMESDGRARLVCSDVDRELLEATLLPRLRAEVATIRATSAARRAGLEIEASVDADGTRRLKLRHR